MAPAPSGGAAALRAALEALTPARPLTPAGPVDLDFDAHHPQGLCRAGGLSWLSTADGAAQRGYLLAFDDGGGLVHRVEVTDGPRCHPGGIDARDGTITVPVAEARPWSSTVVVAVDAHDRSVTPLFRVDDHLGAVARLPGGDLVAVTWASRELLRLGPDGTVLDRRPNPSHYLDVQDVQVVDAETVFCSGVLTYVAGDRLVDLGGVALLDLPSLSWRLEVPVPLWSPAGRALTSNPVRVGLEGGVLHLTAVPDDGRSQVLRHAVP